MGPEFAPEPKLVFAKVLARGLEWELELELELELEFSFSGLCILILAMTASVAIIAPQTSNTIAANRNPSTGGWAVVDESESEGRAMKERKVICVPASKVASVAQFVSTALDWGGVQSACVIDEKRAMRGGGRGNTCVSVSHRKKMSPHAVLIPCIRGQRCLVPSTAWWVRKTGAARASEQASPPAFPSALELQELCRESLNLSPSHRPSVHTRHLSLRHSQDSSPNP